MKIDADGKDVTIREFIMTLLNRTDYDTGAVEEAKRQADNVSEVLARLCTTLVEKKILTKDDIFYIGLGYREE